MEQWWIEKKKKIKRKILIALMPTFIVIVSVALIPILVVNAIGQMFDVEMYEQECPELVRVFLKDHYEEFEQKVRSLCNEPEFMNFVANSEFDNAYTKLVYGGTSAYTQEELKGNYRGVGEQKAGWVTKKGDTYEAKSVLETIQEYMDKGVSANNISISDEYLNGYGKSSGVKYEHLDGNDSRVVAKAMNYETWINNSYYNIPYYYHWGIAKYSTYKEPMTLFGWAYKGTDVGLPNWKEDSKGIWRFMNYANTTGKMYNGRPDIHTEVFSKFSKKNYTNMSYGDYLKTGWTSYKPNKNTAGALTDNQLTDYNHKKTAAYAEGVMLGYKMNVTDTWLGKVLNHLSGADENYDYYPFSKYYDGFRSNVFKSAVDDLYVYKWYDIKSGGKSNYDKYLANPKNIKLLGKREGQVNTNVSEWQDKFAEYFAKEIYYVYPNRDYVVDYFMSSAKKEKKIAFLQRSFYAMATGASLDVNIDEEYAVKYGKIASNITEKSVGSVGVSSYDIKSVKPQTINYVDYDYDTKKSNRVRENVKNSQDIVQKYNGWITQKDYMDNDNFFDVAYKISIVLNLENGKIKEVKDVPVIIHATYQKDGQNERIDYTVKINSDNSYISRLTKKDLEKIKKDIENKWDTEYYNEQYQDNDDAYVERDIDKENNPLDKCKYKKSDNWESIYEGKNVAVSQFDSSLFDSNKLKDKLSKSAKSGNYKENAFITMFDGKLVGEREIPFRFSDHSFLDYKVSEIKDDVGNLKSVNISIYTYYPDVSQYGDENYRVAYAFETEGALKESFKLLDYARKKKTLNGVSKSVDFSQIIISDEKKYIKDNLLIEDSDLLTFLVEYLAQLENHYSGPAYDSVRNAIGGFAESSITVGMFQWYGGRAHNALKYVFNADRKWCRSNLSKETYELLKSGTWAPNVLTQSQVDELRNMMRQGFAREAQIKLAKQDVKAYVDKARELGITEPKLVAYFAQAYHNTPAVGINMVKATVGKYGATVNEHSGEALEYMRTYIKNNTHYYSSTGLAWRYDKAYEVAKDLSFTKNSYSPVSSDKAKKAVDAAVSKSGCPYSQAARNGSTIFDCSSLVSYAWAQAGVDISGGNGMLSVTAAGELQWCEKNAKMVCEGSADLSKLQTGDIIFFTGNPSRYKQIGHVAIYYGNNKVVEAGSPVGVYNLGNRASFHSAWRIVEDKATKTTKKGSRKK